MSSTRPRPPLPLTHSTVRMKKLESDGDDIVCTNDTIPGIRHSNAATSRTRRTRRQPASCSGPVESALHGTGVDRDGLLEVSISAR